MSEQYIHRRDDEMLVRIRKGVRVEQPLLLDNNLSNPERIGNVDIMLEDGAEVKLLLFDHSSPKNSAPEIDRTIHISIGRNATLHLYDVENSSATTRRHSHIILSQAADSNVLINTLTVFNGETENNFHCSFAGENAALHLLGMGICSDRQKLKIYSIIDHAVPHCHSNELFKMTADGYAECSFTGRIHVAEGAVKTEAYQASRNLLITDTARIHSQPELEIYNDDVKCSHGCAIGQLDETQIFYMRTRGIPDHEARLLLRRAFMTEVINAIDIEPLREKMAQLVNDRFNEHR